MRANLLMKQNVNALLRARGLTRKDLAQWCRCSESWISKIMQEDRREFPMKYFDRIADFFGIATYQLLQPGLTPLTERRKGQRRTKSDRRIGAVEHHVRESVSALVSTLTPDDVADLLRIRTLGADDRELLRDSMRQLPRRRKRSPTPPGPGADRAAGAATDPLSPATEPLRKTRGDRDDDA